MYNITVGYIFVLSFNYTPYVLMFYILFIDYKKSAYSLI